MATKPELKRELDRLGVAYHSKDTKTTLEGLLADALEQAAAAEPFQQPAVIPARHTRRHVRDETVTTSAASYKDVTGRCRQCGKPADHLHQGV